MRILEECESYYKFYQANVSWFVSLEEYIRFIDRKHMSQIMQIILNAVSIFLVWRPNWILKSTQKYQIIWIPIQEIDTN